MLAKPIMMAWSLLMLTQACAKPDDQFYDQPYEQQIRQAQRMSTPEVYELYKGAFDQPPPPLTHLSAVLGERGEEALDLWLEDLVARGEMSHEWQFGNLLRELKNKSNLSLCAAPSKLDAAASALAKMRKARKENMVQLLTTYC